MRAKVATLVLYGLADGLALRATSQRRANQRAPAGRTLRRRWLGSGRLAAVLPEVEPRAPYGRVSFHRDPGARSWTLQVQRHEPGVYESAGTCPMTFLYEAATRLLSNARGPPRSGQQAPVER